MSGAAPPRLEVEYDPYSYELDRDPYPVYRELQERAPVYYNERLDFWALSRFDDVHAAFLDWQSFSSARGTVLEIMDRAFGLPIMIFMDPPGQTRLRGLVNRAFTPRRVSALEPHVRALAVGYVDAFAQSGSVDVVREFTARLPMDVISELLGIPPADRDAVRGWSNDILHRDPDVAKPPERSFAALARIHEYLSAQIAERRRAPRDDLMSALTQVELPGADGAPERLGDAELLGFFNLLATAGNETVTKLLASALYWLWRNPDERQKLVSTPAWIPDAVEETLRYDPPSQYQGRMLTRACTMHGVRMPENARVLLINGATGRDPRRFADPERFDVRRQIELHLGFGLGRHLCLGAALARLESRIALEEFLRRVPEYEVRESDIERVHSSNVRGFAVLPLEWKPQGRGG